MNHQPLHDEAALVDSLFSPGGLFDPGYAVVHVERQLVEDGQEDDDDNDADKVAVAAVRTEDYHHSPLLFPQNGAFNPNPSPLALGGFVRPTPITTTTTTIMATNSTAVWRNRDVDEANGGMCSTFETVGAIEAFGSVILSNNSHHNNNNHFDSQPPPPISCVVTDHGQGGIRTAVAVAAPPGLQPPPPPPIYGRFGDTTTTETTSLQRHRNQLLLRHPYAVSTSTTTSSSLNNNYNKHEKESEHYFARGSSEFNEIAFHHQQTHQLASTVSPSLATSNNPIEGPCYYFHRSQQQQQMLRVGICGKISQLIGQDQEEDVEYNDYYSLVHYHKKHSSSLEQQHHQQEEQQQQLQQPTSLRLLKNVHDGCDQSMSTTSSLSSTSSCPTETAEHDENEQEALPMAIPSIVTTCSKRNNSKEHSQRKKQNQLQQQRVNKQSFNYDENIVFVDDDDENLDDDDNDHISDNFVKNEQKIVDDILNESHEDCGTVPQVKMIVDPNQEKSLNATAPRPSNSPPPQKQQQPPPRILLLPEWNAMWSDHETSESCRNNQNVTKKADGGADDTMPCAGASSNDFYSCAMLQCAAASTAAAVITPSRSQQQQHPPAMRETMSIESFWSMWNYSKRTGTLVQSLFDPIAKTWRTIMYCIHYAVLVAFNSLTLLYSLFHLLCTESLAELKEHPNSMECFAIFYLTPPCCSLLMDTMNLPHWTPHVLSTTLVFRLCYPTPNSLSDNKSTTGSSSDTTSAPTAPSLFKRQDDSDVDHAQAVKQWEQQLTATTFWITRLSVAFFFLYDGFSNEVGSIVLLSGSKNATARLLLVSLMTLLRNDMICSPLAWISWSVQVVVAALLLSCQQLQLPLPAFVSELVVTLMTLSSIRYIRSVSVSTTTKASGCRRTDFIMSQQQQ